MQSSARIIFICLVGVFLPIVFLDASDSAQCSWVRWMCSCMCCGAGRSAEVPIPEMEEPLIEENALNTYEDGSWQSTFIKAVGKFYGRVYVGGRLPVTITGKSYAYVVGWHVLWEASEDNFRSFTFEASDGETLSAIVCREKGRNLVFLTPEEFRDKILSAVGHTVSFTSELQSEHAYRDAGFAAFCKRMGEAKRYQFRSTDYLILQVDEFHLVRDGNGYINIVPPCGELPPLIDPAGTALAGIQEEGDDYDEASSSDAEGAGEEK